MGKADRLRKERILAGTEKPFRQVELPPILYLRCGKCGSLMTEHMVAEHLTKCQPFGAKCGKCGQMILPTDFVGHIKSCTGKRLVQLNEPLEIKKPQPPSLDGVE